MIPYADLCTASGCTSRAKNYARFCAKHQHREQAWGHELQQCISSVHLREPMQRLERWYRTTSEGKKTIDLAVEHYVTLAERKAKEYSADLREMMRTGIKISTPYRQTTHMIAEVYGSKDHRKTVMEQLALGILLEESPGMFKNDTAFKYATTHTFLRRSTAKTKFRFRAKQGRAIASTKYLSRRTRTELGNWLTREIVFFGVLIYRQWTKTKREDKEQRDKVIAAIRGDAVATAA
jgi:hypothetical protein